MSVMYIVHLLLSFYYPLVGSSCGVHFMCLHSPMGPVSIITYWIQDVFFLIECSVDWWVWFINEKNFLESIFLRALDEYSS